MKLAPIAVGSSSSCNRLVDTDLDEWQHVEGRRLPADAGRATDATNRGWSPVWSLDH